MVTIEQARAAKAKAIELVEGLGGIRINGVGIGVEENGSFNVSVGTTTQLPDHLIQQIPSEIDGVEVKVKVIGEVAIF